MLSHVFEMESHSRFWDRNCELNQHSTYSTPLFYKSGILKLHDVNTFQIVCVMFKSISGTLPVSSQYFLVLNKNIYYHCTRYSKKDHIYSCATLRAYSVRNYGSFSFTFTFNFKWTISFFNGNIHYLYKAFDTVDNSLLIKKLHHYDFLTIWRNVLNMFHGIIQILLYCQSNVVYLRTESWVIIIYTFYQ